MEHGVLRKRLNTYKSAKGRLDKVHAELVILPKFPGQSFTI